MNERVAELVEELKAVGELHPQQIGALSLDELQEIVSELYTHEVTALDMDQAESEEDAQEIMRSFVETVATKVGAVCLLVNQQSSAGVSLTVSAEQVSSLLIALLRQGAVTVSVETE